MEIVICAVCVTGLFCVGVSISLAVEKKSTDPTSAFVLLLIGSVLCGIGGLTGVFLYLPYIFF